MTSTKVLLLNRRQWVESRKAYQIGLIAITGVLLFMFMLTWHWRDSFGGDVRKGIFLIGLFGGGCIFTSSLLKDLSQPSRAMWFLGIPASAAEKIFIAALYAVLLYCCAFVAIFYLTEGLFLWMVNTKSMILERTDLFKNGFSGFFFIFVNFQLLMLLGSVSFKKFALLKTVVLMITFFALSNTANNYLLTLMTGERSINGGGLYDYFQFTHGGENVYVYLPEAVQQLTTICFRLLLPVTLYYITYQKFRETEI